MNNTKRLKLKLIDYLIALAVVICLAALCATSDAQEEDRQEAHKRETIAAAKKQVRADRLASVASEMRLQLAEAK